MKVLTYNGVIIMKEKIKKIYEVISDKTLNFWCKYTNWACKNIWQIMRYSDWLHIWDFEEKEIIGHPVMLNDVLDWMWQIKTENDILTVIDLWWFKRRPIEEQWTSVIEFIYNLVK